MTSVCFCLFLFCRVCRWWRIPGPLWESVRIFQLSHTRPRRRTSQKTVSSPWQASGLEECGFGHSCLTTCTITPPTSPSSGSSPWRCQLQYHIIPYWPWWPRRKWQVYRPAVSSQEGLWSLYPTDSSRSPPCWPCGYYDWPAEDFVVVKLYSWLIWISRFWSVRPPRCDVHQRISWWQSSSESGSEHYGYQGTNECWWLSPCWAFVWLVRAVLGENDERCS